MTQCEKCAISFEETNIILVYDEKLKFVCKECFELENKIKLQPKPTNTINE